MIKYIWCVHQHNAYLNHNLCITSYLYIYLNDLFFKVKGNFEKSKEIEWWLNSFEWTNIVFLSVHHHNKTFIHTVLFSMDHLFCFQILILWSHKIYCLKFGGLFQKTEWQVDHILSDQNNIFDQEIIKINIFTNNNLFSIFHIYLFHILIVQSKNIYFMIWFCNDQRTSIGKRICFDWTKTVILIRSLS